MPHVIRSTLWLTFFAVILGSWWMMYMMSMSMGLDLLGRPSAMMGQMGMNDMEMGMSMTSFGPVFAMWAIMMAAMMLPTMVPTLRSYEDLMVSADGTRSGFVGVILGYFVVWVAFAAIISGVQIGLIAAGMINKMGMATSRWITAGLLIAVGLFQFTRAKEICHGVCHSPMIYFMGHWKTGFGGGVRMGLGLGAFCVGCCWGFMVLGFVGGVMSLLWMGAATLFMVIEKLPQIGHVVTKPMGIALIAGGLLVIASPIIMGG
jgi:predicted metal-binding membrane protein